MNIPAACTTSDEKERDTCPQIVHHDEATQSHKVGTHFSCCHHPASNGSWWTQTSLIKKFVLQSPAWRHSITDNYSSCTWCYLLFFCLSISLPGGVQLTEICDSLNRHDTKVQKKSLRWCQIIFLKFSSILDTRFCWWWSCFKEFRPTSLEDSFLHSLAKYFWKVRFSWFFIMSWC